MAGCINNFPGPRKAAQVAGLGKPQGLQSPPGGSRSHATGTIKENGPVRFTSRPPHAFLQFAQGNVLSPLDPVGCIFSRGAHVNEYAPGPQGFHRFVKAHPPQTRKE